jgi:hypothetical protein
MKWGMLGIVSAFYNHCSNLSSLKRVEESVPSPYILLLNYRNFSLPNWKDLRIVHIPLPWSTPSKHRGVSLIGSGDLRDLKIGGSNIRMRSPHATLRHVITEYI